ncbi:hypothetical protein RJT34_02894 [Clitoria ternatea]|uniref:Uncharacterized protein n=1 Tax=Clitoria ternatea TaxID=43366 RepID=A0AAN9KIE9_CLITE
MVRLASLSNLADRLCHIAAQKTNLFMEIRDELVKLINKVENEGVGVVNSEDVGDPMIVKTKGAPMKKKYWSKNKKRRCSNCNKIRHSIRKCPLFLSEEGQNIVDRDSTENDNVNGNQDDEKIISNNGFTQVSNVPPSSAQHNVNEPPHSYPAHVAFNPAVYTTPYMNQYHPFQVPQNPNANIVHSVPNQSSLPVHTYPNSMTGTGSIHRQPPMFFPYGGIPPFPSGTLLYPPMNQFPNDAQEYSRGRSLFDQTFSVSSLEWPTRFRIALGAA